jgi:hypothetical protein
MTNSARIRSKIRLARSALDAAALTLWNHPELRSLYPEFLFRNHAVIRASVPLMQAALVTCESKFPADPLTPGLVSYLRRHIPEEMHHDDWVLEDLEVLGFHREQIIARIPPVSVSVLVGSQYYWILHVHPVALLGFIAVLEGTPPIADYFADVFDRASIPQAAASNIFRHAKLDPRHRDDLDLALDSLPLTDYHHSLLGISAFHTVTALARVAEEVYTEGTALTRCSVTYDRPNYFSL